MLRRTDIKSILIISALMIVLAPTYAQAKTCLDTAYVTFSLNAFYAQVSEKNSAAGLEDFDALIDLLVKNDPECLIEVFPLLTSGAQSVILYRAHQQISSPVCKSGYTPNYSDWDWCHPFLRQHKENCFAGEGKPFLWCKAYPPILEKLQKLYHAQTH